MDARGLIALLTTSEAMFYQTIFDKSPMAFSRQRIVWPISWTESSLEPGPNRRPFKAVLFRADVSSVRTPLGGRRAVRIHPSALKALDLDKLIGLPIHVVPTLDHHWIETDGENPQFISIGAIVSVAMIGDGDAIIGEGYLWDRDFPDIVQKVVEAGKKGLLAVSWEIVNVEVAADDSGEFDWILKFEPVGFAFLQAKYAAYRDRMPVLAALQNKESYDPSSLPLSTLLDDHRLLHAFYSNLQRGEDVGDWTVSEVISLHAQVVDEMFKRHVTHNRGDGLSRKLNDESIQKQRFKFYSDELEREIVGFCEIDKSLLEKFRQCYDEREPIEIRADALCDLPEGKPFYIADENFVYGIGAFATFDGRCYLSIQVLYNRPLSRERIAADFEEWKSKASRAVATFAKLPEVIVIPGYIAVTGSSLVADRQNDLDLLVLDNARFERLKKQIEVRFNVPVEVTVTDQPAGLSLPAYDLILVRRDFITPTRPSVDESDFRLAELPTLRFRDDLVARKIRSLADDEELFAPLAFAAYPPVTRTLLTLSRDGIREWVTDEGNELEIPSSLELPDNCNMIVAEVWIADKGYQVADVLYWNATFVSLLPFMWRRKFIAKVANAFGFDVVDWIPFSTDEALKSLLEKVDAVVVQDGSSIYGSGRWLVVKGGDKR